MKRILFTLFVMGLILSHVGVSYSEDEKELKDLQGWLSKLGKNYSIKELKNLTKLSLRFRNIGKLPESIGQLENLITLDLGYNQLETLPKSIGQLINLKYLDLDGNKLETLPKSIGQLINLEQLHLSNNKLKTLPESIGQLINLRELYLKNNKLKTLPKSFGRLKNLEHLDLSYNQLEKLPASIGELMKLKYLNLSHNHLKKIPKSLGQLKNLEYLNLSYNQLEKLPASIGELMKLKYLNLSHNHLKKIPVSLAPLARKLKKKFYIFGNQIGSYPKFVNMDLVNGREKKLTIKKREKKEKQAREQRKLEAKKDYNERFKGKILMGPSYQFLYLSDRGDFHFAGFSYQHVIQQNLRGYGSVAIATDNYFRLPIGGAMIFLAISPITYGFGGSKVGNSLLPLLLMDGLEMRNRIASWFYVSGFVGYSLNIPLKDKNNFLFINEIGFRLSFYPFKGFTIAPFASGLFELLNGDVGYSVGINLSFYF